jgi:hypothetical protein
MRHIPEAGAVCGNPARTDLRGGRGVNLRSYRNTYLPAPVTSLLRPAVKAKRICTAVAGPAHLGLPASHAPRDTSNRLLFTL